MILHIFVSVTASTALPLSHYQQDNKALKNGRAAVVSG